MSFSPLNAVFVVGVAPIGVDPIGVAPIGVDPIDVVPADVVPADVLPVDVIPADVFPECLMSVDAFYRRLNSHALLFLSHKKGGFSLIVVSTHLH